MGRFILCVSQPSTNNVLRYIHRLKKSKNLIFAKNTGSFPWGSNPLEFEFSHESSSSATKTTPSLLSAKRDIWPARFYLKLTYPGYVNLYVNFNHSFHDHQKKPKLCLTCEIGPRLVFWDHDNCQLRKSWQIVGVTQLNFHTLVDRDLYADLKCGGVRSNQNVGCLLLACWLPGTDQQRSHPNVVGPYRATNKQATSNQRTKNVPKTEKHNRSKFGVPMPLENILKCRSTVTLLERDDQTTPKSPHIPPSYSFHGASNTMKLPHNSSCPFKISDIPRFSLKRVKIR